MAKTLLTIPLTQPDSGPFGNHGTQGLNPFGRGTRQRKVTSVFAGGGQVFKVDDPKFDPNVFDKRGSGTARVGDKGLTVDPGDWDKLQRQNDDRSIDRAEDLRSVAPSKRPNPTRAYASGGPFKQRRRARKLAKDGTPRFDFGGLFSGTSGTSNTQTSSAVQSTGETNNNIASQPYLNLENQVLNTASGLQGAPASQYIAPFNQTQQQAFQGVQNNQGSYQPYYNAAEGSFAGAQGTAGQIPGAQQYVTQAAAMPTGSAAAQPYVTEANATAPQNINSYLNPFITNAVDALGQASNKAFTAPGGPLSQINDTFTGGSAAQFGREQHGATVDNAVYNQQQALAQQQAQLLNTGYNSAMTADQTDLARQAGLANTTGTLANQGIQTQAGLGATSAGIGQVGTAAQIAAGQAQQGLGTATQGAGYTDANALLSIGNQQQQLQQQNMSFPLQLAQYQQSLGQGWQLPTNSNFLNTNNSGGSSTTTGTPASGSPFGQVVGGATAVAGLANSLFPSNTQNTSGGSGTTFAHGGQHDPFRDVKHFNVGGFMPTVTGVRKRNAMRKPPQPGPMGGMGGMQPTGMPGMPPPAPPTAQALAPPPMPPPPMAGPMNSPMAKMAGPPQRHARGGQHHFAPGGPMPAAGGAGVLPDGSIAPAGPPSPFGAMPGMAGPQGAQPGQLDVARANWAMMHPQPVQAPAPQAPMMPMGGSANGATGSGGDSTGGVSGTGGVGGSASDSAGGSAAAGTSGDAGSDGGGTYAHGGYYPGFAYGGDTDGALDVDPVADPIAAILASAPKGGASQAKFGPFGPLGQLPSMAGAGVGAGGGGGGSALGGIGSAASGIGSLLGGVAKIIPFLAEGGKFDYGENPFTKRFSHPALAYRVAEYFARGGRTGDGQGNYGVGFIPHMPRAGVPGDPYFASRARGGPFG